MVPLQIAIDGPVAAGKGDIAARIAKKLNLIYIYTGAMYRMLALACITRHVPLNNQEQVTTVLQNISMQLVEPESQSEFSYKAVLNGQDVTERLMYPDTASGSSDVSVHPQVRKMMVELQKKMAEEKRVVMEGRDIGLRVLPNAQLKIFLTASLKERAKRRFLQWKERGIDKTIEEIIEETKARDLRDTTRKTDPLQLLPDAWKLDTTNLTQEEVIEKIQEELQRRKLI